MKKKKEHNLSINGSFDYIIKASVSGNPIPKKKAKKLKKNDIKK